jgi:hypothetical protein
MAGCGSTSPCGDEISHQSNLLRDQNVRCTE